jgi:hypothetical protein
VTDRKLASSTFGDRDSETFSGPSAPATNPPASSAAWRASRAPSRRDLRPGLEVAAVDIEDHLGPSQVEHVGVAGDVPGVRGEALAAVGLLALDAALDQDAPRAVEEDDLLVEELFELFGPVRHPRLCRKSRGRTSGPAGSLGVW